MEHKCNRKNCHDFDSSMADNCHSVGIVEDCPEFTVNETFDLEWIKITDDEKPKDEESILLLIKKPAYKKFDASCDGKPFFHDGLYFAEKKGCFNEGFYYHEDYKKFVNEYIISWARVTLPEEEI